MSFRWQISAGEFFELLRPAAFALAALVSAWVLADARQRRFASYAVAAWTLGAFFLPPVVLPLYLIARTTARRKQVKEETESKEREAERGATSSASNAPLMWNRTLPFLYAVAVLSLGALYFYKDYRSIDAHLARANQARLLSQRERTIREYRAALRLEDDPHTHNLLASELAAAGQWEEALAEFRAAELGGEPDEEIPFHIATMLDALKRPAEAALEHQKFLDTRRCAQSLSDSQCEAARVRVRVAPPNASR